MTRTVPVQDTDAELTARAAAAGVATDYLDWRGEHRVVPADTLRAVLTQLTDAADDSGCLVVRLGATARLEGSATITMEDGSQVRADSALPADLPLGYHRIDGDDGSNRTLIVTPQRLELSDSLAARPAWGIAVQLYSVRSRTSWGVGDLGDLRELAVRAAAEHGADFVLVNPVHAGEVVPPLDPSPYLPTSRRFANPIYLRVEDLPEYHALDHAQRAQVDRLGADTRRPAHELVDRDACWTAKVAALLIMLAAPLPAPRAVAYAAYRDREGDALTQFATWCALCEVHGNDWRSWPAELRDPVSSAVADAGAALAERVEFFARVQWLLDEQLTATQQAAREAGMRVGILHDVAVGVSAAGFDTWAMQDALAGSITVGAPPDAYSQLGQDWHQPPWRPDQLARAGYAPIRAMFASALRHCGGLRVDHVIGLFRLWWIPAGRPPIEGTYVRYDHEALIGVLTLEAQRAGAVVVGEDLGNVEPSARSYLAERGMLGTSILWFESDEHGDPLPAARWRTGCLASVTTHDLPPTAGYLADEHIRLRAELGLLTRPAEDEHRDAAAAREAWCRELARSGALDVDHPDTADLVLALHRFVASTPARLRCIALTDVVGDRRTQNQPGTTDDQHPNWRIPLCGADGAPVLLEDVFDVPGAADLLAAMAGGPRTPDRKDDR